MVLCGPHLSTTTPKKKSIASSRRSVLSLRTRPNFSGHVDGTAGRKSAGSWSCLCAAFGSRARGAEAKFDPKAPDDDRHCRGDRSGGLFLGSGLTIQLAGPGVIISYLLGAAIAAVIAYCLAEMAVVHSFSGSFGIYAESYLSRWAMLQGVGPPTRMSTSPTSDPNRFEMGISTKACPPSSERATCVPLACQATQTVPSDRSTATDGSVALVSELGDTCRVKLVVSAANACSDSSRVDGGGKRYTVAMTAVASRMDTLRKEMATIPSGGWLFLVGFASNSTAEMQIVLLLVA